LFLLLTPLHLLLCLPPLFFLLAPLQILLSLLVQFFILTPLQLFLGLPLLLFLPGPHLLGFRQRKDPLRALDEAVDMLIEGGGLSASSQCRRLRRSSMPSVGKISSIRNGMMVAPAWSAVVTSSKTLGEAFAAAEKIKTKSFASPIALTIEAAQSLP